MHHCISSNNVLSCVLVIIVDRCYFVWWRAENNGVAVIHRHTLYSCITIPLYLLHYVTSATFLSINGRQFGFSDDISLPRLVSVCFNLQLMLWHVLWCSAALMHASSYTGWLDDKKHQSHIANMLLLNCESAKCLTLLTLLFCSD